MQESKGEKLSLEIRFPGSPPKCSTPRMTKPAKFEIRLDHLDTSSSSSCDDSLQSVRSVSSIYSLLKEKFGSAYKKRKIRQKGGSCNGKRRICMTTFREGRNLEGRCCTKLPISA